MNPLVTMLIKSASLSQIFVCCRKRHTMFLAQQNCYDQVSEVPSSVIAYHHVDQVTFSFSLDRHVIGWKFGVIFATRLSCYEAVAQGKLPLSGGKYV